MSRSKGTSSRSRHRNFVVMSSLTDTAQATCEAVLQGLDADVLEYIVSIVVEDDHILEKEDLVEAVCV